MPYKNKEDLPEKVKENLPSHAQEIYLKAFNNAWDQYKEPKERRGKESREETSHKVACAAVKHEPSNISCLGLSNAKHSEHQNHRFQMPSKSMISGPRKLNMRNSQKFYEFLECKS